MAVVTISRQYGSGGDDVAARVCEMLGYRFFDKRLMTRVATEMGLAEGEIVDFSEDNYQMRGFLDRLAVWRGSRAVAQMRSWRENTIGSRVQEIVTLDEADTITFVRGTIEAVYSNDNVVIVGRGGQAILKDKPNTLHVRIEAPYDERVRRLCERENYSFGGAKDAAIKRDRASAEYLKRFHNIDWDEPGLYDLILNTGKFEIEGAAHLIVTAVGYLPSVLPPDDQ